jgi:hypothetical protein
MVELKEKLYLLHQMECLCMVFHLKVLVGTDLKEDSKTPTLRNCSSNSQSFTLVPHQQPQLKQVQASVLKPNKTIEVVRNRNILAQFTSIQREMIDI